MKDIIVDLTDTMLELHSGRRNVMCGDELLVLLFRAVEEIEHLRKVKTDMEWQLNPDRMGGQFTEEELSRSS